LGMTSCGIYSFTGAAIEGKTCNVQLIENRAPLIAPSLSPTFTQKLRQRIIAQSSLTQLNSDETDYTISGYISGYDVSVVALTGRETASKNRLSITVQIDFKNKLNEKANFSQSFMRFADFNSSDNLQSIETRLIGEISDQLADDIFNKAFVNW
jgi:hypothetical protein